MAEEKRESPTDKEVEDILNDLNVILSSLDGGQWPSVLAGPSIAVADALPDAPIPEDIGQDQIRRVAFLYLVRSEVARDTLARLLDQTARTVPKKPLFLRRVLYQAITQDFDAKEVLARVLQAKAVAALGIVEGLSDARLRELGETLAGGGVKFRPVALLDVGKKSLAVDIVADVMLLPSEAP
jgi:hypothetical protein